MTRRGPRIVLGKVRRRGSYRLPSISIIVLFLLLIFIYFVL